MAGDEDRRLDRVEQDVGFAGRGVERLEAVVAELSGQIHVLHERLERLEKRLSDLTTEHGEVGDGPPPHSHRGL